MSNVVRIKTLSPGAEKRLIRKIKRLKYEQGAGAAIDIARYTLELARARQYRDCNVPEKVWIEKRRRRIALDPVVEMFKRGDLDQMQFQSAEEIRGVWEALSQSRDLRAASLTPSVDSNAAYKHPLECMAGGAARDYWSRWRPWADDMSKIYLMRKLPGGAEVPALCFLTLAIDIAAHRESINSLIRRMGGNRATGLRYVKTSFLKCLDAWKTAA